MAADQGPSPDAGPVRVDRTGIALVHEGEYIGPDPVSAAGLHAAATGSDEGPACSDTADEREVHYHFPIEIEVVGAADPDLVDAVVARVFDELRRELASRP